MCKNDIPIAGLLSEEKLVELGFLTSNPVKYVLGLVDDDGACSIQQDNDPTDSGIEVPLYLSYSADEKLYQKQLDEINTEIADPSITNRAFIQKSRGKFDVLIFTEALDLYQIAHIQSIQANGLASTFTITWADFSEDRALQIPARQRRLESLVDTLIDRGLKFEQRDLPSPTEWFVCNENNLGVTGADPAALMTLLSADTSDIEIDIETSLSGSKICEAFVDTGKFADGYRIEVSVRDSSALFGGMSTPVTNFLESKRDEGAVQETIEGQLVAVLIAESFFRQKGVVVAAPNNVTVEIGIRVPRQFEAQLGEWTRSVAAGIIRHLP